jgi:hypothetical protein
MFESVLKNYNQERKLLEQNEVTINQKIEQASEQLNYAMVIGLNGVPI